MSSGSMSNTMLSLQNVWGWVPCGRDEHSTFVTECIIVYFTKQKKMVMFPEKVLFASLLFTPIVGVIYLTNHLRKSGNIRFIVWSWLTALLCFMVSIQMLTFHPIISLIIYCSWALAIYVLQRPVLPDISVSNLVMTVVIFLLASGVSIWKVASVIHDSHFVGVKIGSKIIHIGTTLDVEGTDVSSHNTIYALLKTSQPFGNSVLTMVIEQKYGSAWALIDSEPINVNPDASQAIQSFQIPGPGRYQVMFTDNDYHLASGYFTARN